MRVSRGGFLVGRGVEGRRGRGGGWREGGRGGGGGGGGGEREGERGREDRREGGEQVSQDS